MGCVVTASSGTTHLAKGVLGEEGGGLVLPSGNVHLSGGQGNASVLGRNQGLERAEVTGEGVDGLARGEEKNERAA